MDKKNAADSMPSNHKVQVAKLAANGNRPEEWQQYIQTVRARLHIHILEESRQRSITDYVYVLAFKAIPKTSKTEAYANLLIEFAEFKSKYDVAEAERLLSFARRTLRKFAIVHVASAELEYKRDNKEKAVRILQRAPVMEQKDTIDLALQRLLEDRLPLLGEDTKENELGSSCNYSSGVETSGELSSHLSGPVGESSCRDLFKLTLTGSRSNTQEVQQDLDYLTQHHGDPSHHFSMKKSSQHPSPPSGDEGHHYSLKKSSQHPSPPGDESHHGPPLSQRCDNQGGQSRINHSHTAQPTFPHTAQPTLSHTAQPTPPHTAQSTLFLSTHPDTAQSSLPVSPCPLPTTSGSVACPPSAASSNSLLSSSSLKTPSPPKFLSHYVQDGCTKMKSQQQSASKKGLERSDSFVISSVGLAKPAPLLQILESPVSKQQPSPPKRSLVHYYSTPVLHGPIAGTASLLKTSVRKFQPSKPMPPPRRVRVDPTMRALWDKGGEDTADVTLSAFQPLEGQARSSTLGDVSRSNGSGEAEPEHQGKMSKSCEVSGHMFQSNPHNTGQASVNQTEDEAPSKSSTFQVDSSDNGRSRERELPSVEGPPTKWDKESRVSALKPVVSSSIPPSVEPGRGELSSSQRLEVSDVEALAGGCGAGPVGQGYGQENPAPQPSHQLEHKQGQQEIVKQQVLVQQQQLQQQISKLPSAGNPTYSVHPGNAVPVTYITPAKQTLQPGQKTMFVKGKPYTVLCLAGRGGSAKVYRVLDVSANLCALKVVNLSCADPTIVEGYKNEIALLKKLQHCDRVIKLFDSEYNELSQKLFLVLEYGEIDLDKHINQNVTNHHQLPPIEVAYLWLQMVTAVNAMHKEGVIHSDLKPANFMLVAGKVKLIDFGIANSIQQENTSVLKDSKVGTPSYMSPEMLKANGTGLGDNRPRYKVGMRSDVWSLGCILYLMVYGRTPFQNVPNKLEAIINPNHVIPFPETQDPVLVDVLKKCLQRDVHLRPTTEELLKHPYLEIKNSAPAATPKPPPTLASKLSLLETVFSSASPRTKEALGLKLKQLSSNGDMG